MVTPSYVTMHDSGGYNVNYTYFRLNDTGDASCSQENYWADLYFGRWTPDPINDCFCQVQGECRTGDVNVCPDAQNFGRAQRTYDGP
ncbi:MAG: hypothetical protein M1401_13200 [Chloroflexi bacterium]|nr:hypothetical protein [Chloroflexota bacterium]